MGEKRPHPVRHLQELFAVVAGVAFVLSVERIVDTSAHGLPINWGAFALFVAFGVTALTFFQDTALYLDLMYIEQELGPVGVIRALADVVTGSIYLFVLIALSIEVERPFAFAVTLLVLLTIGIARVLLTWGVSRRMLRIERTYLVTSLVAVAVLAVTLVSLEILGSGASLRDSVLKGVVLTVAVARTGAQTMLSFSDYFPQDRSIGERPET